MPRILARPLVRYTPVCGNCNFCDETTLPRIGCGNSSRLIERLVGRDAPPSPDLLLVSWHRLAKALV